MEATLARGSPLLISLETHALLQRKLQDARTMKPVAATSRAADSGQGLLGRQPTVSIGALPIAGPSGEACAEKQEKKKKKVPTLKADTHSGAEAPGSLAPRGQECLCPPELWWVGLSPISHCLSRQGRPASSHSQYRGFLPATQVPTLPPSCLMLGAPPQPGLALTLAQTASTTPRLRPPLS